MKQVASVISTYSSDVFGVCSALFELGGMLVIHDPSGCNSTYTTHDEPRWYDMDSMLYISALTEIDAITGNDDKLVQDIIAAVKLQRPAFIVIIGSPIPAIVGTDLPAIAALVEQQTGIMTFSLPTNNMHSYVRGISLAFAAVAEKLVMAPAEACCNNSDTVNVLGVTPLDFSNNGSAESLRCCLNDAGFQVNSIWAMGDSLADIRGTACAAVNLVVSYGGLSAARILRERFGTPYVLGVPIGSCLRKIIWKMLRQAARENRCLSAYPVRTCADKSSDIVLIGESIYTISLAEAIEAETGRATRVVCPVDTAPDILRYGDVQAEDETDIIPLLEGAQTIIADPLYAPICPGTAQFIALPHEGFSGRLYRSRIPDLISNFAAFVAANFVAR